MSKAWERAMNKVVTVNQMRILEREAEALGLPGPALMENAGRAVAEVIRARFRVTTFRQVLVLVGPGNNGGDGLVAARHLADAGFDVVVYLVDRPFSQDAKLALLQQRHVPLISLADDLGLIRLDTALAEADLLVDAVLGTGRARPIVDGMADVLDHANRQRPRAVIVSVDLPTGVNADTGQADPHAVHADLTITLGNPKRGLLLGDGVDLAGEVVVVDIGIPAVLEATIPIDYASPASIARLLPHRSRAGHKGTFGRALVVAGSVHYTGAPVLAALGAERIGAGLVTLACPASVRESLAAHTVETTFLPLPDEGTGTLTPASLEPLLAVLADYAGLLVGPGIGRSPATATFLEQLLARYPRPELPLVVDADALTLLGQWEHWWERLPRQVILTPHVGEMARLSGQPPPTDRIEWAVTSARSWRAVVVLKGPYTVVAQPDERATVEPFATPALATAGTGDVLAGAILGLLAQGLAAGDAATAGAFVHGLAGQIMEQQIGPSGGLATDLASLLSRALTSLRATARR